jgi:hypothetical protein
VVNNVKNLPALEKFLKKSLQKCLPVQKMAVSLHR